MRGWGRAVQVTWVMGILLAGGMDAAQAASKPAKSEGKIEISAKEMVLRGEKIQISAKEIVLRRDGTVERAKGGGAKSNVGSDIEFAQALGPGSRSLVRAGPKLIPAEWGTSLLVHTEFRPKKGILFRFEWRKEGKPVRTEEVLSRDFAPVTRTLLIEPDTGLKHVIRFTPSVEQEEEEGTPAPRRVDRMKFRPGGVPGPLLRDGKMVDLVPGFWSSFERAYVSIPGTGFFQFSLHPFPGSEPSGQVEGSVLTFPWRGAKYSWYLGRDPLPEGTWTVYVKATKEIPSEWREDIPPEYRNNVVVGGANGPP